MNFRIADTFTASLARLTGEEQKLVKQTAFDAQMDPSHPGLRFHKLERARDKNFWSLSAGMDLRIIVHRTAGDLLFCYTDHHDRAYAWAEKRKLAIHPRTGAAQLVEIRERVEEVVTRRAVAPKKPALFAACPADALLAYGVPEEWLDDVYAADEDTLLDLADHLPAEAAEALLRLAVGEKPEERPAQAANADPFAHPDAGRRFRLMRDAAELEQALNAPWEKWLVFLHPAQRGLVERSFRGPARVSGSAGTGKTIVALHRAVFLARKHPGGRVLLATFSETLAHALAAKLRLLVGPDAELSGRIAVHALESLGRELYARTAPAAPDGKTPRVADDSDLRRLLTEAALAAKATGETDEDFSPRFLENEWRNVVDFRQIADWPTYRDAARPGSRTRLSKQRRERLWAVFARTRAALRENGLVTLPGLFAALAERFAGGAPPPFDFCVVDEAQDIGAQELRFLAALGGGREDALFFAGDLGQRIFQQPFSWKSLGVDIRGRSQTLRLNYRTSHQIRRQADRLLNPEQADVDGNVEERRGTVSVFNGPEPQILNQPDPEAEIAAVGERLADWAARGLRPKEIGVFVRTDRELDRARAAVRAAGLAFSELDGRMDEPAARTGRVAVAVMHLAKGLEFRAVAVMACDDEIVPLQERVGAAADEAELDEAYNTERHLLYVACTRARDHLLLSSAGHPSEFLEDLA